VSRYPLVALVAFACAVAGCGNTVPSPTTPASASAVGQASSTAATACSGQHWPQPVPRDVIGQNFGFATTGTLLCFNVVAAYAQGSSHDVMNDPASTSDQWLIARISPAPGAVVRASTPLTLYLKPANPATMPTDTAICSPKTNAGTCYKPGEYCRAGDHGSSGIDGDGELIICKDNGGWRWEPA
jgi:hypothetical protein